MGRSGIDAADRAAQEVRKRHGAALARLRITRGLSQESVAAAVEPVTTAQNISRYERGAPTVTDVVARRKLLSAIGATEEEFQAELASLGSDGPAAVRVARMAAALGGGLSEPQRAFQPELRQAVFPLADGEVTVSFPARLSPEGRREMRRFLELLLASTESE